MPQLHKMPTSTGYDQSLPRLTSTSITTSQIESIPTSSSAVKSSGVDTVRQLNVYMRHSQSYLSPR